MSEHPAGAGVFTVTQGVVPEGPHPEDAGFFTLYQDPTRHDLPLRFHPKDAETFTFFLDPSLVPDPTDPGVARWGLPIVQATEVTDIPMDPGLHVLPISALGSEDSLGYPLVGSSEYSDTAAMPRLLELGDGRVLVVYMETLNTAFGDHDVTPLKEKMYAFFATEGAPPEVTDPVLILDLHAVFPGLGVTSEHLQIHSLTRFSNNLVLVEYIVNEAPPTPNNWHNLKILINISGSNPSLQHVDSSSTALPIYSRGGFSIGNNKAVFMRASTSGPDHEIWTIESFNGTVWSVLATFNPSGTTFSNLTAGDYAYDAATGRGVISNSTGVGTYTNTLSPFVVSEATNTITFGVATGADDYENYAIGSIVSMGNGVFVFDAHSRSFNTSVDDSPVWVLTCQVNADATVSDFTERMQTQLVKVNWVGEFNTEVPEYELSEGVGTTNFRWRSVGRLADNRWGFFCTTWRPDSDSDFALLEVREDDIYAQWSGEDTGEMESDFWSGWVDALMTINGTWIVTVFTGPTVEESDPEGEYIPSTLRIAFVPNDPTPLEGFGYGPFGVGLFGNTVEGEGMGHGPFGSGPFGGE